MLIAAALLAVAATVALAPPVRAAVVRHETAHTPTAVAQPASRSGRHVRPQVFGSMATAGPVAQATSINPVVKPFSFFLVYHPVNGHQIALKAFEIKPFFVHQAPPIGGCLHCLGNGIFQPYTVKHNELTEKVKGKRLLSTNTRFGQGIIRRGEIGRFKVIGVELNPARPFARQEGCLGADTGVTSGDLIYGHKLPIVACNGANPRDFTTNFNAPAELSKTTNLHGTVSGRTKGRRWLSVLKVHAACGPTAQATAHIKGSSGAVWTVKGRFSKTFTTGLDTRAGNFCVYLQTGARWHTIPDGRISQRGEIPFFGGDTVSISQSPVVAPGQMASNTFSGFASASAGEYLWTFDSTQPCAATAAAEYGPSIGLGVNSVHGLFSIPVTSVALSQSTYRCAYLNYGTPHRVSANTYTPTGPTLAMASTLVTVS
jgi:hypothetical protein